MIYIQQTKDNYLLYTDYFCFRENGAVIGVILDIPKVQRHHFGKYVCNVGLPGSDEYIKKSSIISDSGVSMVEDTRY